MFCIRVTYPNGTLHKTDDMMWSRIKHTTILDDPFDDPAGLADLIPDKSPELKPPAEVNTVTDSIFVISFFQQVHFQVYFPVELSAVFTIHDC